MTSLGHKGKGASVNGARSRRFGLFQYCSCYILTYAMSILYGRNSDEPAGTSESNTA